MEKPWMSGLPWREDDHGSGNHGRENYRGAKMIMAMENHGRENYRGVKKDIGSHEHVRYI